jgi:hypothetical protein
MKKRRHHNNKGTRQIKRGKTHHQVKAMALRVGLRLNPGRFVAKDGGKVVLLDEDKG